MKSAVTRRRFLQTASGGVLTALAVKGNATRENLVSIVEFTDSGERKGVVKREKVVKTDAEWKGQLTPAQFEVTRRAGTELAFLNKYWHLHQKGIFRCVCCGNALFSSDA